MMHNVPLPPLGSFAFNILYEGIKRERTERIAFARFLARLIGPMSGLEQETTSLIIAQYAEEVLQFNYNSKYEPVARKVVRDRVKKISEDQRILKKVAAMTVTDEGLNANG